MTFLESDGGKIILSVAIAFTIAQILKGVIYSINNYNSSWQQRLKIFVSNGGMPSGHAAMVAALLTAVIKVSGVNSVDFALALVIALLVVHDAVTVRRAVGINAKILKETAQLKPVKVVEGHSYIEAAVGIVLGVAVALIYLAMV